MSQEDEDKDKLTLHLLDWIDAYAAVQEVITKRLADIIHLLSREKFHARGGGERLDVLLLDQRPHPATCKCTPNEKSLNASTDWPLSTNLLQHFSWSVIHESKESDLEEFCLSPTLKEARKMSHNLISLVLEAVNIQGEINHLLEILSQHLSESNEDRDDSFAKMEHTSH
ncbi:hypothetical protein GAYE_PCTG44G1086 [Galdieria yellowstonensis]|uniref:Uncharacterized protein n=1 Tax=Galdieria yellowstonensis TaxID=3028027 RepID=A0AAV9I4A4_9RHOD|nr:hypothetical protein GAYE_PCTG44G1086 [Galdieria yellowstonensis]